MNDKRTATGDIDRLQEIFEIVKSLSSTLELDALLKRIGEAAERLTDSEASSIMLLDDDKRHLYFKVATGEKVAVLKKIRVRLGEGIAGAVAVSKKAEIINDTSKDPRFTGRVDMQSGFSTRSILAVPISFGDDHRLIGVAEVLNKRGNGQYTVRDQRVLESLAGLAAVTIMNAIFNENQRNFFVNMTELLVSAVETVRPRYTGRYWRMTKLATLIGREMGLDSSDEEYRDIYFGSLLHDIGYLSPRFSTELEGAAGIMERAQAERAHVAIGSDMLAKINLLKSVAPVVRHHHEAFDGTGYPDGLKGKDIPTGSQIIAVAEFVEELRMSGAADEEVIRQLDAQSGRRFDPDIVRIAREVLPVAV
jgi:HD-GYP domain-containing protein (c-di-GMP phosphodiesterase class II)